MSHTIYMIWRLLPQPEEATLAVVHIVQSLVFVVLAGASIIGFG